MTSSFCLRNFMTKLLMYGTFTAMLPTAWRILLFIYLFLFMQVLNFTRYVCRRHRHVSSWHYGPFKQSV